MMLLHIILNAAAAATAAADDVDDDDDDDDNYLCCKKTCLPGYLPVPTQTNLYNLWILKTEDLFYLHSEKKALISCTFTRQLISAPLF